MIDSSVLLNDKPISRNPVLKTDDSSDSSKTQTITTVDHYDLIDSSVHTPSSETDIHLSEFPITKESQQTNMSNIQNYRYLQQNTQNSSPSAVNASKQQKNSISKFSISSGENDVHNKSHSFINDSKTNVENTEQNYYPSSFNSASAPLSANLYILKIQNVPSDLTPRESHLLFALMMDSTPRSIEILQDGSEKYVKAVISDLNVAVNTAIILESKKNLFGPFFPFKSFIQLFDNRSLQQIPFNDPSFSLNVKADPRTSSGTELNQLRFVDPFHSSLHMDPPRSGSSQVGMGNVNIWHNENIDHNKGLSRDLSANYLRQNFENSHYGTRSSGMNDYDSYSVSGSQMLNKRISRATTANDIYSPPRSASGINGAGSISHLLNGSVENINTSRSNTGGRMNSLTDVPLSQLRKASLSMTTASYGTDPRMSIAAGSLDGSIMRLENYIISRKHLRNMPIIYASIPGITEADLDSLARVPPPTNPADQNPPCNTLYVGNLSPETVESDMRDLFGKEEGFLRISFRSKPNNNNKNNHGPMCFVEFEEILYAARSLAKLYGVEVQPKASHSEHSFESDNSESGMKKMVGIRLSFSKNPLGVKNTKSTMNHAQKPIKQPEDHEYIDDPRRYNRPDLQISSIKSNEYNANNINYRQSISSPKNNMNSSNWRNAYGDHPPSRDSGRWSGKRHEEVVNDPRYTFGDNAVVFDRERETEDIYKQFR